MKEFLSILLLLFFVSCATTNNKKKKSRSAKRSSSRPVTQKEKVLEKYRLMRTRSRNYKSRRGRYKRVTPKRHVRRRKPFTPEQIESLKIEINQNLSYYCMKHRKDGRFQSENECKNFTQDVFAGCLEKIGLIQNRDMLYCIKRRLVN